jgi:hypothetical protein
MASSEALRGGDSLRESSAAREATVVDNSAGLYPTEDWEATYFSTSRRGRLTAHRLTVRVPAGLEATSPQVRIGQPGCVYGVRRWGFALRPSALEAAGFDTVALAPSAVAAEGDDTGALRFMLQAASYELPGEFVIASPEHPFRLVAPDGTLRGSWMQWYTYLGALSFFVSGGSVEADYLRFWVEARDSYHRAVDLCLAALGATSPET